MPSSMAATSRAFSRPRDHVGGHIRRARTSSFEIIGVTSRTLALGEKHQLVKPWRLKGKVKVDIEDYS
jgi:hypothetical protein